MVNIPPIDPLHVDLKEVIRVMSEDTMLIDKRHYCRCLAWCVLNLGSHNNARRAMQLALPYLQKSKEPGAAYAAKDIEQAIADMKEV